MGIEKGVEKSGYLVKDASGHLPKAEIELLFGNLGLVAGATVRGRGIDLDRRAGETCNGSQARNWDSRGGMDRRRPRIVSAVPGVFAFRGDDFNRLAAGCSQGEGGGIQLRSRGNLTPAVVGREVLRLVKAHREAGHFDVTWSLFAPSLLGMVFAFLAGLLALKWLSRWLEGGRWHFFGVYCLAAAAAVFALHCRGY